jgi:cation-transporting ATPase 13A1
MLIDFAGCWLLEVGCKYLFADLEPKPMITRGRERREARRALEEEQKAKEVEVKKDQ